MNFNSNEIDNRGYLVHPTEDGRLNFKQWFRNSKVVNSSGNPLVMYHGTFSSFDSFDKNKIGSRFSSDTEGFFAINCPKIASEYAEYESIVGNPIVLPLYISLQKPLIINKSFLTSENMHEIGINDDVITFWDNYQDFLMNLSYDKKADGVILIDESKLKFSENIVMTVAFNSSQIKSAIGNIGSFNLKSSSLTDNTELELSNKKEKSNKNRF